MGGSGYTSGSGYSSSGGGSAPQKNVASHIKTGQTASYRTNDDGDLQRGRETDFFTLSSNNPFGNTNRFTDTTGAQTYADDWVIDWAFSNYVDETVIGWYRLVQGGGGVTWSTAIDGQPYTLGGYNDCYLPNFTESNSILRMEGIPLDYPPFNYNLSSSLWTCTTSPNNSINARYVNLTGGANLAKTNTINYIVMRIFTFAELGL